MNVPVTFSENDGSFNAGFSGTYNIGGGASKQYELIEEVTLEEDVESFARTADTNGVPYDFSAVTIFVEVPAYADAITGNMLIFALLNANEKYVTYFEKAGAIATTAKRTKFTARNDCGIADILAFSVSSSSGANVWAERGHTSELWSNVTKITFATYVSSGKQLIPAGTKITIYGIRG